MALMTAAELQAFLVEHFPDFDHDAYLVEEVTAETLRLRRRLDRRHLRPGGTVLGPALMEAADMAAYFCVLAPLGPVALAVTSSLTIHFLRKPRLVDVVAHARALRRGKRLAVVEVFLHSDGEEEPVAQATITYAIPAEG